MKNMFKTIILIYIFCIFNIDVFAINESDLYFENELYYEPELDSKMYLNPKWIEYMKLNPEEKKNFEAIPEQYVYDYEPKYNILDNYNFNYFSLDGGKSNESYFNLANVDGKRYVNSSNKNQSSLGLCWAFASIGAIESNILLNGVNGTETCTESSNSKYCKNEASYKNDENLNNYYINNAISCENGNCLDINGNLITDTNGNAKKVVIDNATFSERYIDYLRSKPYTSNAYNNESGNYTLISEQYNYYSNNSQIGSGGSYGTVYDYLGYGIAPLRTESIWEKYTTSHNTYTLEQVFDSVDNLYQVKNYYLYPSSPSNEEDRKLWIQELKGNIVKYGSLYVGTGVPDSRFGSCYYNDTAKGIKLMNDTGNCGKYASHALQIIGWDDNYKFGYCKVTEKRVFKDGSGYEMRYYGSNEDFHDETSCENDTITKEGFDYYPGGKKEFESTLTGEWTEGTGAWIIKNSWGAGTTLYSYLSYQSSIGTLFGVREVGITDFDNTYNKKNSKLSTTSSSVIVNGVSGRQTIYTYNKNNNTEYLKSFNVHTSSSNTFMEVYVSNGGDYKLIDTINVDYAGMYSFDVDNIELSGEEFSIKVIGPYVSTINAFTINECTYEDNCDLNTQDINSYIETNLDEDLEYFPDGEINFDVYTKTRNVPSGTKLTYKILDDNGVDVSSNFELTSNYVIKNANIGNVRLIEEVPYGEYVLEISSNDLKEEFKFYIVDDIEITFDIDSYIYLHDGSKKINATLSSTEGTSNYIWESSDTNVATIDSNGLLTPLKSGKTTVSLSIDTYYGTITKNKIIYIYDNIDNTDEFLDMFIEGNQDGIYYLTTDLDFKDVNFNDYPAALEDKNFTGIFDGQNHIVKNIRKSSTVEDKNIGLFNRTYNARISNLIIKDSVFEGKEHVGSLIGFAVNTDISNVYNYSDVSSTYVAGGIIGGTMSTAVEECYNGGKVRAVSSKIGTYAGGIIGYPYQDIIKNSYNEGDVYSETSVDRSLTYIDKAIAGGIVGYSLGERIVNSYNIGKVYATTPIIDNEAHFSGLKGYKDDLVTSSIWRSYYLVDDAYTLKYPGNEKTLEQLKKQETFASWDFENVWYINENKTTPILRAIPVEAENVQFNIFSNILNNNYIYNYTYEVLPYTVSAEVIVYSEDNELFEVKNNQIITKTKTGTSNIVFKVGNKEFKYPITVKPMLNYDYDKSITNNDVTVNIDINYYNENINNSYLKLIYTINNKINEIGFNYNNNINEFRFDVEENSDIILDLYLCNTECTLVNKEQFKIDNIDKEPPQITVESNNINSTLKISVFDNGISGLSSDNEYLYAVSNSSTLSPMTFNNYVPNQVMNNIFMNHMMKYLWVKNISDKVGNKASVNEYIIYNLNIENVDAENITFDLFSNIINPNNEYDFDYQVTPINITNDVKISSEDNELFEVIDNKIITKNKTGTSNIVFKVGNKTFKYPITIKEIIEYNYNDNLTNKDVDVKIQTNYFEGVLDDDTYLKFVYKIGKLEYVVNFDKNKAINEFSFKVSSNNNIDLNLYVCNENCNLINTKNFDITNIDKEKPVINYIADNINSTLQINIKDFGVSGLNNKNVYKYAISNSNEKIPNSFKEYVPNTNMNNIKMDKEYKYLWVKNISDNAGNEVSEDDYIVYTIDLKAIYYNINYYDKDKSTLLKTEKIKEDDIVLINYNAINYEDDDYLYEFDYWEGYTNGMIATSNIILYPIYKKIPKELQSDIYIIDKGYIYNIKLDNINKEYGIDTFKSNLKNYNSYSFYESNNAYISNINSIKTGLKFKNQTYEYKIVLAGDVTGDGKVKMNDVMKIANHLVNKNVLFDEYLLAGDVTNDNNTKMNDVMKIASSLVNGGSL